MEQTLEEEIKYLKSVNDGRLICPRCGWFEGKAWHCGLCEGHEENIVRYYKNRDAQIKRKAIEEYTEWLSDRQLGFCGASASIYPSKTSMLEVAQAYLKQLDDRKGGGE